MLGRTDESSRSKLPQTSRRSNKSSMLVAASIAVGRATTMTNRWWPAAEAG
jgi:hypothetical protein